MKKTRLYGMLTALAVLIGMTAVSCGGPAPKAQDVPASEMKAMTFNIRYDNPGDGPNAWPHRREAVIKMLDDLRPDILGIQEGLVNQVLYLDSALTNYSYVGVGRDDGMTAGEYSAVYYNHDRYERLDDGHFWLSETPDVPEMGWDAVCIRIATWIKLREKDTGKEFVVFNTHFDHIGKVARQESAKLLLARVQEFGDSIPAIIMGDLNYPVTDPSLAPLVNAPTFKEARSTAAVIPQGDRLPSRTFQGFREHAEGPRGDAPSEVDTESLPIDHIFVQGFEPTEYVVVTDGYGVPFLSDHYPVMATLKF